MEIGHKVAKIYRIILLINFLLLYPAYAQAALLTPEYISSIQQKISTSFVYPQEAQTKGWEGMVKVRFTLDQDGRIKEIDIAESSGYPLLDAGALLAVKDAGPYPLPQGYNQEELEMVVPISYKQDKLLEPAKPQEAPSLQQAPLAQSLKLPVPGEEIAVSAGELKGASPASDQALSDFFDLAVKNNPPLQVARQEIELAQFKILENQRNLFPTLKISGYNTTGDVYKVDYAEWEPRVEVAQPLFRGGQLVDAVRQAGVDLEISKKNYDRIKFELMQKTETAYYNLAVVKLHLKLKEALLEEAKETLEKIEKLGRADMVIPLEVNSARSWFDQLQFQVETIKQDVLTAELTLKQVLNTSELRDITPAQLSGTKKTKLDLSTCTEIALVNHPDIRLSELLVKFNDYSQKMKRNEVNSFSVDLTSSYGYYTGHYKGTPWEDTDNWFAGVKLTKPWGGSTFSTSYNAQKQRARFGETSPSKDQTVSADFSILDNLKRVSDKKKSDIDLRRSLSDFNETTKAVTLEVQEAFFNYQKSISQLNTSEMEMKFRRNETDVIKIRSMVGEANLSSAMESLYNLSESQAKYIQALVNYRTSLANLKKATGYAIQI